MVWRRTLGVEENDDLIIRICTQAGVIMEDKSFVALTVGGLSSSDRAMIVKELSAWVETLRSLLSAAEALCERSAG